MRKILVGLGFFIITCAILLLSEGVPVTVVQEILGYSSAFVTMDVYSHVHA